MIKNYKSFIDSWFLRLDNRIKFLKNGDIMKVKSQKLMIFFIFILMCCVLALPLSGRLFSSAQEGTATTLSEGDKRLSQSYLDKYAVPSSYITPYTDRGGDDTLKYAFDRDWNTAYRAEQEANDGTLQIVFNDQVKLSGIIFAIAQDATNQKPNGYPLQFMVTLTYLLRVLQARHQKIKCYFLLTQLFAAQ